MDIDGWLRGIGLAQYAEMFRANDIDIELLGRLTNDDLKDIGVVSFGHRKKLLEAIAELAGAVPVSPQPALIEPKAHDAAERRQVTVMFSDLVGSTALSARMDPEDLREVISAYQKCVAETVRRFGGFVAKYMGDGVLVYFGYPQAHEDDAERAVRAGLELVAAVSGAQDARSAADPCRHRDRAGRRRRSDRIGRVTGARHRRRDAEPCRAVAGRLPSRTAWSSPRARESSSAICSSLRTSGPKDLKGIAGPVRAWAALRQASVESRFEALHASGLTDLVGREEELELLLRRWSKAKTGEGQVVLLSGEAGHRQVSTDGSAAGAHCCRTAHALALFLLAAAHRQRVLSDHQPDGACRRIGARRQPRKQSSTSWMPLLAQSFTPRQDAALFAEMLSLPNDGRYPDARTGSAATATEDAGGAYGANRGADPTQVRC